MRGVTGWESFEPWLSRVEEMEAGTLWAIAEAVPPEWYGGDPAMIERLMETDAEAAGAGAGVDRGVSGSDREPFPKWASGGRRWWCRDSLLSSEWELRVKSFVM